VVSTDELGALVEMLGASLSPLESEVLAAFMAGDSYEAIAERAGCDPKAVDNALQRVKRKIEQHRDSRTA
jgi:RNA polymerase sporulation-specific sigma factor